MSSTEVYEGVLRVVEKYGLAVVLSVALIWMLRNDVLVPLVEEHRLFVRSLSETQKEISKAVGDQTRILMQLQQDDERR